MLTAGRGKNAANLAHQTVVRPQAAALVEEILHLCSHVAEARWRADDDGVVLGQLGNGSDIRRLRRPVARLACDVLRNELRHPFDLCERSCLTNPIGHGVGQRLDMPIRGVIQHQYLSHRSNPRCHWTEPTISTGDALQE